ncbi:glycosyltransferase [Candidatus Fermentibacteria bacterium]|nr:glycosyltransferase [Candidatus Fermentibacteria bacterium]
MHADAAVRLTIVMPSYGEAETLSEMLPELAEALPPGRWALTTLIVNDLGVPDPHLEEVARLHSAQVLDAPHNMGSQEAIVYGIREQVRRFRADYVVTMDADGQDDPAAIAELIDCARGGSIAVAQRTGRRPEGRLFRSMYALYKRLFRVLTGVTPDFGNFAAFSQVMADQIARSPFFHVTYSMALPKLGTIARVPVPRRARAHDRSRVGAQGLFDHALRSSLPHLNTIALRVATFSLVPATLGILLALTSSFLRLCVPVYAFPNWATTIAFGAAMLALQLLTICLVLFLVASLSRQIAASRFTRDG